MAVEAGSRNGVSGMNCQSTISMSVVIARFNYNFQYQSAKIRSRTFMWSSHLNSSVGGGDPCRAQPHVDARNNQSQCHHLLQGLCHESKAMMTSYKHRIGVWRNREERRDKMQLRAMKVGDQNRIYHQSQVESARV